LIRLLLDPGLPRSTGKHFSLVDWDVVHVGEIGMSTSSDKEILEAGRLDNRVCVTLDADFHALLATTYASSPSTVRIRREGLDARSIAELLQTIWPRIIQAVDGGAMVTVTERSVRVRSLPISRK
jgi:predicted nuclease of predicted toxin-antitoxin system